MVFSLIDYSLMPKRSTNLPAETRDRIRRIFARRQTYPISQVASLLGVEIGALSALIAAGDIAATGRGRDLSLAWAEVAYLALRQWPLEIVFDALGDGTSALLPVLLRPIHLTVSLPTYQVKMLELLARLDQLDVSTYLQIYLLDLASASDQAILAEEIPGFIEALHFPYGGGT